MSDAKVNDANLKLLIDLRQHLASADRLRDAFERLLALASHSPTQPADAKAVSHVAR